MQIFHAVFINLLSNAIRFVSHTANNRAHKPENGELGRWSFEFINNSVVFAGFTSLLLHIYLVLSFFVPLMLCHAYNLSYV